MRVYEVEEGEGIGEGEFCECTMVARLSGTKSLSIEDRQGEVN